MINFRESIGISGVRRCRGNIRRRGVNIPEWGGRVLVDLEWLVMTSTNLGLFLGLFGWKEGEISLPLLVTP